MTATLTDDDTTYAKKVDITQTEGGYGKLMQQIVQVKILQKMQLLVSWVKLIKNLCY